MKIVTPKYEILKCPTAEEATKFIELIGRTCYQSEDKIDEDSHLTFCRKILDNGHFPILEFGGDIVVRFTSNRGFMAEITRHRLCSFAVESTRYCDFSKNKFDKQISVIGLAAEDLLPKKSFDEQLEAMNIYFAAQEEAERAYLKLKALGVPAEMARGVLPINLKVEMNVKANLTEWRHIFKLRANRKAHLQMRTLMNDLLKDLKVKLPLIFDDIKGLEL